MLFAMNPAKEPKDRRHDKAERLRFAIRKANDRMFAVLQTPKPKEPAPEPRH